MAHTKVWFVTGAARGLGIDLVEIVTLAVELGSFRTELLVEGSSTT